MTSTEPRKARGATLSQNGKIFRHLSPHFLWATRVVANPGMINLHLFEKHPGLLNWIEIRGVRRMGLRRDVIPFEEGGNDFCIVYTSVFVLK